MFPGPYIPPAWVVTPACSDDTLLTPQRSSSQFYHASNIPSLKSNPPSSRFPRQYCGPIQTDRFSPADGDLGDPGGSCENWRGQIINHQATDEAVTPTLSRESQVWTVSCYQPVSVSHEWP